MNTQTLDLDVGKRGTGEVVRIGQGDTHGTTIAARIYDNGSELSLTGSTVYLVALLPDKTHYYRGVCTVSGNVAICVVDESKLAAVHGYTDEAYFTITKGGATCSTERFAIEILRSALDGQKPAESWDSAINDIVNRGNAAVSAAASAATAANSAAKAANAAAASVEAAKANAQKAADAANSAASAANTAKTNADKAAASANSAATDATKAATDATAAATDAKKATASARNAASNATVATEAANGAAEDATAAAQRALAIANSISAAKPPAGTDVDELRASNAALATELAEIKDGYIVLGEVAYMPASRKAALAGESVTIAKASVADATATLS